MARGFKNAARFFQVGWTLGRYDALFFLRGAPKKYTRLHFWIGILSALAPTKSSLKSLEPGARLAKALNILGPAYIKLGQTFATRSDLVGDETAAHLRLLQDSLPSVPTDEIIAAIEADQEKSIDELFSHFDPEPKAAASIAQVHFALTKEGEEVAVKVLRPGIEEAMARDIESFEWLAGIFEKYMARARRLKLKEVVATLKETVTVELDLRMEAAAATELAENMKTEKGYRIPRIDWARTSRRVLTMERVKGTPIHEYKNKKKAKKISETIVRVFLTQAIRDGFFHADLHQGNFFIETDGTLVAVDFGIMGRLDKPSRKYLAEILWGFHSRNYRLIADVHFQAGYVPKDQSPELFAQAMRALAEPIMDRPLKEVSPGDFLLQMFRTAEKFSMETQPQLLTLQRSMVMVEGLALTLDKDVNMWAISKPVLERWAGGLFGPGAKFAEAIEILKSFLKLLPDFTGLLRAILAEFEKRMAPKKAA